MLNIKTIKINNGCPIIGIAMLNAFDVIEIPFKELSDHTPVSKIEKPVIPAARAE